MKGTRALCGNCGKNRKLLECRWKNWQRSFILCKPCRVSITDAIKVVVRKNLAEQEAALAQGRIDTASVENDGPLLGHAVDFVVKEEILANAV